MCSDNPKLPKEANKAKCVAVACFVFSVFSMIGFAGGTAGIVGALCGLLACVASSILMCCAPKSAKDGGCKFTAAGVLLLIAGIIQLIMGSIVIFQIATLVNAVSESSSDCKGYSTCTVDDGANLCSDNYCFKDPDAASPARRECATKHDYDSCKGIHDFGSAIMGAAVFIMGIAAGFLFIAGTLNTIGGAYCIKAKNAIARAGHGSESLEHAHGGGGLDSTQLSQPLDLYPRIQ